MNALRKEAEVAAIALLVAMMVGSLLIVLGGQSPLRVWAALFERTLGDRYGAAQVLFKATPLILTGLAVAVGLRVGLFNIGVEAQMVAGLFVCGVVGAGLPAGTPAILAVPVCLLAAMVTSGALGGLVGILKVWRDAHEVIVSIMMNAIVAGVVLYYGGAGLFVHETTRTADIVAGAELPSLGLASSAVSWAWPLALVVAAAVGALFTRTRTGAEWRAVGEAPEAARTAGIDPRRAIVIAMVVSGALAGLASAHYVLGYKHAYEDGLGRGAGFLGVAVAMLGRGRAGGIVAAALLIGLLSQGGLAVSDLVPRELMDVLIGVIILAIAAVTRKRP